MLDQINCVYWSFHSKERPYFKLFHFLYIDLKGNQEVVHDNIQNGFIISSTRQIFNSWSLICIRYIITSETIRLKFSYTKRLFYQLATANETIFIYLAYKLHSECHSMYCIMTRWVNKRWWCIGLIFQNSLIDRTDL